MSIICVRCCDPSSSICCRRPSRSRGGWAQPARPVLQAPSPSRFLLVRLARCFSLFPAVAPVRCRPVLHPLSTHRCTPLTLDSTRSPSPLTGSPLIHTAPLSLSLSLRPHAEPIQPPQRRRRHDQRARCNHCSRRVPSCCSNITAATSWTRTGRTHGCPRRPRRSVQLESRLGLLCSVRSGRRAREGVESLRQRAHGHRGRSRVRNNKQPQASRSVSPVHRPRLSRPADRPPHLVLSSRCLFGVCRSVGTTYYPADISLAQKAVQDTLDAFVAVQQSLLALDREDEAQRIRESWSLRLEQLKAELDAAIKAGGADH